MAGAGTDLGEFPGNRGNRGIPCKNSVEPVSDRAQKLSFLISRSARRVDLSLFAVKASKVVLFLCYFTSMIPQLLRKVE